MSSPTGRMPRDPEIQNIPLDSELAKEIKDALVAKKMARIPVRSIFDPIPKDRPYPEET